MNLFTTAVKFVPIVFVLTLLNPMFAQASDRSSYLLRFPEPIRSRMNLTHSCTRVLRRVAPEARRFIVAKEERAAFDKHIKTDILIPLQKLAMLPRLSVEEEETLNRLRNDLRDLVAPIFINVLFAGFPVLSMRYQMMEEVVGDTLTNLQVAVELGEYNPHNTARFSTYAIKCLLNLLQKHIHQNPMRYAKNSDAMKDKTGVIRSSASTQAAAREVAERILMLAEQELTLHQRGLVAEVAKGKSRHQIARERQTSKTSVAKSVALAYSAFSKLRCEELNVDETKVEPINDDTIIVLKHVAPEAFEKAFPSRKS